MKDKQTYKCGEKCPKSGQYRAIGSKGEITIVKNNRFPPISDGKTKYKLVDETKHKKGGK
ncbi:hypothetical protein HDR67_03220 [bacterium]|nr:hypothetical protein [bacterium]